MSEIGQQLIEIVRQKAAENPGHVYQRPRQENGRFAPCQYVQEGGPGCIVGHALWDAGLINPLFEGNDHNFSPVYAIVDVLGLTIDPDEVDWLIKVQSRQDQQYPWGAAVERADSMCAL